MKFYWGTEERRDEIDKSTKRDQTGATFFIESISGKKTFSVLNETPIKNLMKTLVLIFLAMCIAWVVWYLCMKQLAKWLKDIPGLGAKSWKLPRLWINVIVYSIAVIKFNGYFKGFVGKLVTKENLKYKKDHEESLI